jgi:hypothetical protein
MNECYFPFGEKLKKVQQLGTTPKKAFVLGVYASAVHARWVDNNGKQKVAALAVASEPKIFWTGEEAAQIIGKIRIPEDLGKLTEPLDRNLNGHSGRTLDECYLTPLGLNRNTTWLCDLLPESRVNENQRKAIEKHYTTDIIQRYNLTEPSIPSFTKSELDSPVRRQEILEELRTSNAETLIILGDLPIYWFLRFQDKRFTKLSQFGDTDDSYGREHEIRIDEKTYNVIPLCHPRQAKRLGSSSTKWGGLHDNWIKQNQVD